MSSEAPVVPISPEDQWHINMAERGADSGHDAVLPAPAAPAVPAAVAGAAPAVATPAAAGTPAAPAFPAPEPAAGFEFATPLAAPVADPIARIAERIAERLPIAAPVTPAAVATADPIGDRLATLLADPELSTEARAAYELAQASHQRTLALEKRLDETNAQLAQRTQSDEQRAEDAADAQITAEFVELQTRYHLTNEEVSGVRAAWERQHLITPGGLANLTAEEATRRSFGSAALAARAKSATPAPGQPPNLTVVPGTGPAAGQLVSDAAGGGPVASRGQFVRSGEVRPHSGLEESRSQAHAWLNSR